MLTQAYKDKLTLRVFDIHKEPSSPLSPVTYMIKIDGMPLISNNWTNKYASISTATTRIVKEFIELYQRYGLCDAAWVKAETARYPNRESWANGFHEEYKKLLELDVEIGALTIIEEDSEKYNQLVRERIKIFVRRLIDENYIEFVPTYC